MAKKTLKTNKTIIAIGKGIVRTGAIEGCEVMGPDGDNHYSVRVRTMSGDNHVQHFPVDQKDDEKRKVESRNLAEEFAFQLMDNLETSEPDPGE